MLSAASEVLSRLLHADLLMPRRTFESDPTPCHSLSDKGTIIDVLREWAVRQPHELAYVFLGDGDTQPIEWTYEMLERRVANIAALLRSHVDVGTRALLVYDPGLEYVAAFLGCLHAGVIAVPTQPPRRKRACDLLQKIMADSGATLALTTTDVHTSIEHQFDSISELRALRWLTTDDRPVNNDFSGPDTSLNANSIAFLQYTSGSTGDPKGVMVTHGNLIHNLSAIRDGFRIDPDGMGVTWLPMFHDMGLIGGILEPMFVGARTTLMSPVSFVQNPVRWLKAITQYRGTISGGPTFAYQLCTEKISAEQRAELDLSSWRTAFCGAEPISDEVLGKFADTFAPCGFRREAFYPCYGMAESTLMITGGTGAAAPTVIHVCPQKLRENRVEVTGRDGQAFIACGLATPGTDVVIVDPETQRRCANDRVGEIWTCGPSVARGYWNRPELTEEMFGGGLHDSERGPYLRTGDLGFIHAGQLYVTGRLKDVIVIRGQNHYSQDIERTAEGCSESLRSSAGAAFSVRVKDEERLVLVHEVERGQSDIDTDEVMAEIASQISNNHELVPYAIVLVRPHSIPRTTSGKIKRTACRDDFQRDELKVVAKWVSTDIAEASASATATPDTNGPAMTAREQAVCRSIRHWLVQQLAHKMKVAADRIDVNKSLALLGVDSLIAMEISMDLERWLEFPLSPDIVMQHPTIESLSRHLASCCHALGVVVQPAADEIGQDGGLSHTLCRTKEDEVRAALGALASIRQVEAFEYCQENGSPSLVGCFVPQADSMPSLIALRQVLKRHFDGADSLALLPLTSIPLTDRGEVDRTQLLAELKTPPRDSLEEQLLEAWREALKTKDIGIFENVGSWGGGAADRVKVAAMVIENGYHMTPAIVVAHPSIAEMAELLRSPNHPPLVRPGKPQAGHADAAIVADPAKARKMVIESLGVYLPTKVVSTDEVLQACTREVTFPLELITGIRNRREAGTTEFSIDLATKAIEQCLASSSRTADDIDLLICCSISRHDGPDRMSFEPSTAIRLKKHFGCDNALAFDISNACAGMFTAIHLAQAYLASGRVQCALVVSGEYITHLTKTAQQEIAGFKDERLACLTLGDAGAAVMLENALDDTVGFHDINLYTLGHYGDLCIGKATDQPHGGAIMYSQPSKLASVAIRHSVLHAASTCAVNLWSRDTADHVIMHQTSESSIKAATQAMNLLANKTLRANTINNLAERGNTASTSHFVALWDAILDGQIQSDQQIMFPISASGQTVGTALYTLDDLPVRLRQAQASGRKPNGDRSPQRRKASPQGTAPCARIESVGVVPVDRQPDDTDTVSLAVAAAEQCLERSQYRREDIELLIFTGVYRSEFLSEPAVAAIIAGELGLNADVDPLSTRKTFAFDIVNSAMGTLNACDVARQAIIADKYRRVMVVAAEIENNTHVRPSDLRGVQETASAMILDDGRPTEEGFGRLVIKYFTDYIGAFRCDSRLTDGRPYLQMERDPQLDAYYWKCIAASVREFLASEEPDAVRPTLVLPPQFSSSFSSRLMEVLELGDLPIVDVAARDKDLFTSSLAYAWQAAKHDLRPNRGEVGLIIEVSPGIQVACAKYHF
jgi:acyl-CoA synthetase (AMP-forming)/AMP-acid ligase II/3-oxoacyl-[acyl-carrier-protein] synthase III/acyl carrier protein